MWQIEKRISSEILGVKGLNFLLFEFIILLMKSFFFNKRLINTFVNWMLTWQGLNQISRSNMPRKRATQIMKVSLVLETVIYNLVKVT